MAQELEIQVLSDRREGLLIDLGKLVIEHGYALLRQRMLQGSQGVQLTMIVRGPADRQLALEDALNAHPRVIGIEAGVHEGGRIEAPAVAAATAAQATPGKVNGVARSVPDLARVEAVLPMIASDFPRIFPRLLSLERDLDTAARDASLRQIGLRTGAWVYKRDLALGGRLPLAEAIKRLGLPALRMLVNAELHDERLRVRNSPLCQPGHGHGPTCHFFCGYLEGVLTESGTAPVVTVQEAFCRTTGADACVFEVSA